MSEKDENSLKENYCLENVTEWLKKVRFKKKLFGGVDERDVWKKIDELNNLYSNALIAERARYDALLHAANPGDVEDV